MSCNAGGNSCNACKKQDECSSGGGFFSWFTGGGSSSGDDCNKCKDCGMENCNCNCALRDHLKDCCGLGCLPPLITKDNCPCKPACEDPCAEKKAPACCPRPTAACDEAPKCCGTINWPKEDACPKPKNDCCPAPAPAADPCCKPKPKCCFPETDVSSCIPPWICPPTCSGVKDYEAPCGVTIYPISFKARSAGAKGAGCGCGAAGGAAEKCAPNVANKDCPMIRNNNNSRSCEKKEEPKGGFFEKIFALFGGKK